MPKTWIEALKEYNKDSDNWCIPKKGTKSFERIQRIMNDDIKDENQAAIKIQSLVRGFQGKKKVQKERTLRALEKYKHLTPQTYLADMMKPNPNFLGNEQYIWNQIKEENQKRQIRKYASMTPLYGLMRK